MDYNYIANPIHFGETLREQIFIKRTAEDLGGWHTFALVPGFIKLAPNSYFYYPILDLMLRAEPGTFNDRACFRSKTSISNYDYELIKLSSKAQIHICGKTIVAWDDYDALLIMQDHKSVINFNRRYCSDWYWI